MRLKRGKIVWRALIVLSWLALLGGILVGLAQPPDSIGADAALFLIILSVTACVLWSVIWAGCLLTSRIWELARSKTDEQRQVMPERLLKPDHGELGPA